MGPKASLKRLTATFPPPVLLAMLYLTFIVFGTLLLTLPFARTEAISFLDNFFMAVSAVTVTGLVVVDPGTAYTFFGQLVIAFLIQLGGLGLMAFAVLLLVTLGVSVGLPSRVVISEELGAPSFNALTSLAKLVLTVAVLTEVVCATLLATVFIPEMGVLNGIWSSIFHAISAFNNAGFSLNSDSLMGYVANPVVSIVIPLTFILGGIGFIVMSDVWQERRWRSLTLHSKLMLTGTLVLTLVSWMLFALLEWSNPATLGGMDGTAGRLLASFFQATTPRTAGFNTLDTAAMEDSTMLMTMALMFVGGGPTSTAGGIKVTTAIVLFLAIIAFFKRRDTLNVFGRSLDLKAVLEVMALTTISVALVALSLFVLTLTEDGAFLDLAFEAVSAFGTVGLSLGATGELGPVAQVAICVLMFLGRVGPLTLGFMLATRTGQRVHYPPGQVYMG